MTDLERVTARAVECGIYGANKTLINAAPRFLLAFEQATLKEANSEIGRLKNRLGETDPIQVDDLKETIEQLQREKAALIKLCKDTALHTKEIKTFVNMDKIIEATKESTDKWMELQDAKNFELFGYIEPRNNFEPM